MRGNPGLLSGTARMELEATPFGGVPSGRDSRDSLRAR